MILIAKYPILFESKQYNPGDRLPTHNAEMIEAWLDCCAAFWDSEIGTENTLDNGTLGIDEASDSQISATKAALITEAGLPGMAVGSDSENTENLVGKVPKTNARAKRETRTSGK